MKLPALSRWGRKRPQTPGSCGALAAILAPSAFGLTACLIDLGDLSGGTRDGGSGGGPAPLGVLDCAPCPGAGCTPQAIASGADTSTPDGLAITDEGVYWVNQATGTVMRLAATGGAPQV